MESVQEREEQVLGFWKKKKIYEKLKKRNAKGKKFYFLQGPPYTSGRLHIAHAWNNSMKDLVLRYKRMHGFNVWDRGGYDMHGLPTENAVQKKLKIRDKLEIEKYGVEKFIKECIKFSSDNAKLMDKDLERLGIWMDFKNAYWPIKEEFIEGEWWLIKKAWEQDRLYKGKKVMQWCSSCETSLAKHELEYQTIKENSIFLKFKVKDTENEYLVIWTTTPWTIPFNLAVMVNPEIDYVKAEVDGENGKEKWIVAKPLAGAFIETVAEKKFKVVEEFKGKKLEGLEYEHPLYPQLQKVYDGLKRKWKKVHTVILSEQYVDTSAGSGLVHCAPGCGPEDYEVGKKYGLEAFNEIDGKGVFQNMGAFTGLVAKRDDKKFVKALEEAGSLIAQTNVEHEYAHCWRCHKPVVFRATEQWFMKIEDLLNKLVDFNKDVKWQPGFASKNYDSWTENLKDNGITRQRYWGCPVPIWTCKCGNMEVIGSKDELKKKSTNGKLPKDLHKPWIDKVKLKCSKCKAEMTRVPDVIDVWIDSGTASWNCLYYPKTKKNFNLFPADFILEATEQIRLWFSMLQICSAIALGKSCYKNVYAHGMILDYQGMKMSKSLGNVISPYEVIDKSGADILRYYMCETPAGQNINFNWEEIKIKQRNLNVFSNISRFLIDLNKQTKPDKKLDMEEKYILSRKNSTIKKVTELMEEYRIDEIISEIEGLFLDLSRVYIQFVREKVNSKDIGKVLFAISETYVELVKMFSIVSPFVTERVWQNLKENKIVKEESVHLAKWPKYDARKINSDLEKDFDFIRKIIEVGMAKRDEVKMGLKWPLAKATISTNEKISKELQQIIARQLNVKKVEIKKAKETTVELDTKLTPELEAEGYMREIARKFQALRKKSGLQKENKIKAFIQTNPEMIKMLLKHVKSLKERINATELQLEDNYIAVKGFKHFTDVKIKDSELKLGFNQV
ncbi:isoleucine--tRNA ligase [Nanoarchaeota archaeon]